MLLPYALETLLVAALLLSGGGLGLQEDLSAGCLSPAGCESLESGTAKALCAGKDCGARLLGEPCGVYTPGCARGLRCIPRPGERAPLRALLRGKGICLVGMRKKDGERNRTKAEPVEGDRWKESRPAAGHSTAEPLSLLSQVPLREAPCRVHLTAILQELKAPLYPSGEDIFIPNCDIKGFYRRKQCQASKGQKRGQCWCVDKRGHRLEGLKDDSLCRPGSSD